MEPTKHQPHFLQILNVFYDYSFKVASLTDFLIKEVCESDRIPVAAEVTVTFR